MSVHYRLRNWEGNAQALEVVLTRQLNIRPLLNGRRCVACDAHIQKAGRVFCKKCTGSSSRDRFEKYKLTVKQFDKMLESCQNKCEICRTEFQTIITKRGHKKFDAQIDHDHNSGIVRGLLCTRCNTSIQMLERDEGWIESAIQYLAKHNTGATCRDQS